MKTLKSFFAAAVLAAYGALAVAASPEPAPTPVSEALSLSTYKPMYFLIGDPDTKVQVSFKLKILRSFDLYLGYSQLMMWQIFRTSAPMRDINFNPEFFYRLYLSEANPDQRLDVGIIEHESNGVGSFGSRSWNRSSLRYSNVLRIDDRSRLYWSIKGWVPYTREFTNPELQRYRGLYEVNLEFVNLLGPLFDSGDLIFRFYGGGPSGVDPFKGGQELSMRLRTRWQQLLLPVTVQLFHGFGESLLDYRQEVFALRAGFGF